LAGHVGRFKAGEREGYILKLMDEIERACFSKLFKDVLVDYVPKIDKIVVDREDGKYYTEMQDLLYGFSNPFIMDIKIGVRTFLEDDYMSEGETKARNDLYLRMIEVSPNEPNEYENSVKAITKKRYMMWREKSTCSSTLGFRIEAIKKSHVSDKQFYTVREKAEVKKHFKNFVDNNKVILVS
jgi:1D-myo-inositol-triphosphate 3-kinase